MQLLNFGVNYNFATENVFVAISQDQGQPFPPVSGDFNLLDETDFLLLDNTKFLLL